MATKTVHAACPHDCPDACSVLITVQDGRATRIQGDPEHPVTRGFLCAKVAKYLDRVYSPDRVLYPYRRIRPKRSTTCNKDDFQRITWDEALDRIVTRFRDIARQHGAEAILPYSYGGTLGVLNSGSMDRRFFAKLGASQLHRSICSETGEVAIRSVYGLKLGTEPEQFAHSRYIIAWGANIHGNNIHLWPFIEEARRNGAKLVVIDPYRTRTAACADWYLPINPGTDVALALGVMNVIINEGLIDRAYIAEHTLGFEQLRERVQQYPPAEAARWTGISAEDISRLAREYATTRPAVIRLNYGIQRCENGGMNVRAVCMLPCLTGSWKEVGGGLQLSLSEAQNLNKNALKRDDLFAAPTRTINMVELGKALTESSDPPVKALFVYNSNPAAIAPNHNAVVRGLMRPDLFTVVHEQFFTDTTDYADIVLPATTFFEHKDLQTGYGHYFVQISNQAIEPLGECRSNVETFRALAERMGFTDACFRDSVDHLIDQALSSTHPHVHGITRARLEREQWVRLNLPTNIAGDGVGRDGVAGGGVDRDGVAPVSDPRAATESRNRLAHRGSGGEAEQKSTSAGGAAPYLPFAHGFATPNGKALLYNESLVALGLDPVVSFTPPTESRHRNKSRYPLELLARKSDNHLNSTFCNLPTHQKMETPGLLEISAADAASRGIRDGDRVRVFNDRGEIALTAHVNGATRPGVVAGRLDWAKLSGQQRNINVLTSDRLNDLGGGATFYSTLVEVARLD